MDENFIPEETNINGSFPLPEPESVAPQNENPDSTPEQAPVETASPEAAPAPEVFQNDAPADNVTEAYADPAPTQAAEPVPTEANPEENAYQSEFSFADNLPPDGDTRDTVPHFDDFTEEKPPVHLAPVTRIPLNASHKGARVFAFALAAVVLLSCAMAGGYFLGKNGGFTLKHKKADVTIEIKKAPKDKTALSAAKLYKKVKNSIVGIQIYNKENSASASGVIFTEDGYIITNDHIYDGIASPEFTVYTSDGKTHNAVYVAGDTRSDLAVLKIEENAKFTPATFGNSAELYIGEDVAAVGCPVTADIPPNITTGIISMLNRRLSVTSNYAIKFIQTDAPFNPGSSGGALLNMYGQVIGITSAKISGEDYEGLFFAIPSADVKKVAESLIEHGYVEGRAKMGISYQEVTAAVSNAYGYTKGLYVAEISDNSDAAGKLSVGDVITQINGKKVEKDDTVLDIIESSKPGDTVTVTAVTQKGGSKTVTIKLLEDRGSSSYSTSSPKNDEKDKANPFGGNQNGNGGDSKDNSGSFDFPFGE